MMMSVIVVWTIYERPDDFPDHYVARRFEVSMGEVSSTNQVIVANSLALIRRHLEQYHGHFTLVPRAADDEPSVVETWV